MKYLILSSLILLFSCQSQEPDSACFQALEDKGNGPCTLEFRSVVLKIQGGSLDSFYTLRNCTSEQIKYEPKEMDATYYTVLDDGFQSRMINRREIFWFVGLISGKEVVREKFVIEADRCHIRLVEGKTEINL